MEFPIPNTTEQQHTSEEPQTEPELGFLREKIASLTEPEKVEEVETERNWKTEREEWVLWVEVLGTWGKTERDEWGRASTGERSEYAQRDGWYRYGEKLKFFYFEENFILLDFS